MATAPALKGSSWREAGGCSVLFCSESSFHGVVGVLARGRAAGGVAPRTAQPWGPRRCGPWGGRARDAPGTFFRCSRQGHSTATAPPGLPTARAPRHRPRPHVRWVEGGSACSEAAGSGRALDRGTGSGDGSGPARGADKRPRPGQPPSPQPGWS